MLLAGAGARLCPPGACGTRAEILTLVCPSFHLSELRFSAFLCKTVLGFARGEASSLFLHPLAWLQLREEEEVGCLSSAAA